MMDATPAPTESPTALQIVLAAVPSWAPWGLGLLIVATIAWWALPPLFRSGLPQKTARMATDRIREALVKRAAPVTPPSTASPGAPPARPAEATTPPASPASDDSPRSVKATIAIASIPSIASLVWTAWSLIDMIPAPLPVGLAAGVVLDIAMVSAIAIAWINTDVAPGAKKFGWFVASIAAVLVGWHAYEMLPALVILGIIPLVATGLWHFALNAHLSRVAAKAAAKKDRLAKEAKEAEAKRLAEEQAAAREAELSTDPTHEERKLVAEKRRKAAHERELAEAEVELSDAQAERDHKLKLAAIRRAAAETREMERQDADVIKQRVALLREIKAGQGIALGSGEVPSDLSSLPASPSASLMGFGSAMTPDLQSPRSASPASTGSEVLRPELQDLLDYIADAGQGASVRGASRDLGVDPATIRRRRDSLVEMGRTRDVAPILRRKN